MNECIIDYSVRKNPKVKIHSDQIIGFDEGEEGDRIAEIYLRRYYKVHQKIEDEETIKKLVAEEKTKFKEEIM